MNVFFFSVLFSPISVATFCLRLNEHEQFIPTKNFGKIIFRITVTVLSLAHIKYLLENDENIQEIIKTVIYYIHSFDQRDVSADRNLFLRFG